MKIQGDGPNRITGVYNKRIEINRYEKLSGIGAKKDELSISSQARDYQSVMKALKSVPDVRKDKIDEIAKRYEAGTYSISGNAIIDKLLKSSGERKNIF